MSKSSNIPKQKLLLMADTDNVFNYPQATIDAHKLGTEDVEKISDTIKLFLSKAKSHFSYSIMEKQYNNGFKFFDFVRLKHPLPATFNVREKRVIINVNIWKKKDLLNISPPDMYSTFVYGYVSAYYTINDIPQSDVNIVLDYMTNVWIKLFAKKYGLIGSYVSEIPKFRFLINLHTLVSFFGMPQKLAYKGAANLAKTNIDAFDINLDDYDFFNTKDLIRALSDSGVLFGISLHEFASTVIKFLDAICLAMFEDGMRFMATIAGASITSATLFPPTIPRFNITLYERLLKSLETIK
jgi:hypothetical protein